LKINYSYEINNEDPETRKKSIQGMFNSIVPTYDLLNRILSFGIDTRWRKSLISLSGATKNDPVLDLCCGTGDLSNLFLKAGADLVSLDFSVEMLKKGRQKKWLGSKTLAADACCLPFADNTFKYLSISFGIRNIPDLDNFLEESFRVLKPGGKLLILELTRPSSRIISFFYKFYLGKFLPFMGGVISGKKTAYKYLSGTISTFIDPDELVSIVTKNNFSDVKMEKKTFGISTIYMCQKA